MTSKIISAKVFEFLQSNNFEMDFDREIEIIRQLNEDRLVDYNQRLSYNFDAGNGKKTVRTENRSYFATNQSTCTIFVPCAEPTEFNKEAIRQQLEVKLEFYFRYSREYTLVERYENGNIAAFSRIDALDCVDTLVKLLAKPSSIFKYEIERNGIVIARIYSGERYKKHVYIQDVGLEEIEANDQKRKIESRMWFLEGYYKSKEGVQ